MKQFCINNSKDLIATTCMAIKPELSTDILKHFYLSTVLKYFLHHCMLVRLPELLHIHSNLGEEIVLQV